MVGIHQLNIVATERRRRRTSKIV